MTHFTAILALLWWSETESAISPRTAYTSLSWSLGGHYKTTLPSKPREQTGQQSLTLETWAADKNQTWF